MLLLVVAAALARIAAGALAKTVVEAPGVALGVAVAVVLAEATVATKTSQGWPKTLLLRSTIRPCAHRNA